MVGKIVQTLGEMDVLYPNGYSYEELSEFLLSKIEKLGMLPPENPNLSKEVIDNCLSGNYWEEE